MNIKYTYALNDIKINAQRVWIIRLYSHHNFAFKTLEKEATVQKL